MRCHNDKRQFKSNSFITSIQEARHEPISKAASSNSQNNQTHNNCYGNYQSQSDGFPQENHDTELSSNGSNALALESSHFRGLKRSRSMAQPQETLNDEPEKEGHVRFCEVFVNDTIGRWINLSLFHSYEHLLENLAHMFSMTDSQLRSGLFYDGPGGIRRSVGKEPYKDFMKTSKIYIYPNMSL
ncbi:auxin response factor 16-like isoform X2 [Amborella trichopoda]|uniref:auxin response factor 16-like isoform X2 n=1 Tax=Amborella trichopoda TaxID=13333 RepID=UPI0009BD4A4A|nr:auxin response factor 16-like isoform X2 [Amborella trichopoda]|eukprot:XP_020523939.1 auxin response factor 16-like isoform X2 [Amborella trichopoda]